ncbi:phage tail assembly chaperone family protein, TAC [Acinetobacter sp. CFCC 10889]|uniref:phage tail assembly chaperone family protein, TAC n=1 Tax=Acinetobacter sp. CFCC 10889 TaxID=1775557 RepID=UPI000DCFCADE|nr:phage tail assembly chaperone family protein, TAC [Acinetobacter sp. CFCC 10889]
MAKLTLKDTKKQLGIGTFVEKTIKFRDKNGEEFEGEIFVKILSHDEVTKAADVLGLAKDNKITVDQLRKSILLKCVYEDDKKPFFPNLESTGEVSSEILTAMYDAVDDAMNISGKHWISNLKKNSGASLSSTESAEKP